MTATHIVLDVDKDLWVDLKPVDELYSGDLLAINLAADIPLDAEGNRVMPAGFGHKRTKVLLKQIVTNWSFELPLPSDSPESLDKIPLRPWKKLTAALDPWWDAINGNGEEDPTSSSD